jgi:2-polyprenyl-3-methyl-5-hydroxy-6-metoxy-1,4-benzoquinol methylase
VILDIPDLRVPVDAWIDFDRDRELARSMAAKYSTSTFADLVAEVWSVRTQVPAELAERRIRAILRLQEKHEAELGSGGWMAAATAGGSKTLLEIGCGTAALLAPATKHFGSVTGVDISMAWLVAAKKRLAEMGVACRLVCACAEKLPFPSGAFDAIVALDVLEHVHDPAEVLKEVHRLCSAGAAVLCSTPNRFSLTAEPHVGIWGVGFLPRRWMAAYVRWRNGMDYHHTQPLSRLDLARYFAPAFEYDVAAPKLWPRDIEEFSRGKRQAARVYNQLLNSRLAARAIVPIAPFFHVIATPRKPE